MLAAPAALAPLALRTGAVDRVLDTAPLAAPRPGTRPAVAVNLHGRGPQSHRAVLAARPRRLLAFAHPEVPESAGHPAWRAREHEVARWCRLLAGEGVPADPADLHLALDPDPAAAGATILHPGAAAPARRWPPERWAAVARAERAAGRRVLITGSAAEAGLARAVAERAGLSPAAVLAGRTDLLGLARLVAGAGRLACGDTGVAHLATALGTPSVVLFGPVPPAEWGPPARLRDGRHRVLWRGRRGDPHARTPDPGLLAIEPGEVIAGLGALPLRAAIPGVPRRVGNPLPS